MAFLYIAATIVFTVYGQVILKWRLTGLKFELPEGLIAKLFSLLKILLDPYIFSGFASAFIASLFWMATMSKMEITKAYPFMSISPGLVFLIGIMFLNEQFTWGKLIGLAFIAVGLIITVKL